MPEALPRKTLKPWGYELLYALTPQYAGKVIFVKKGHRLSLQYHERKDETMYIYSGKLKVERGVQETGLSTGEMEAGGTLHLPAGTRHRITALEDSLILEVSTAELQDVVRLADDYGRAGQ